MRRPGSPPTPLIGSPVSGWSVSCRPVQSVIVLVLFASTSLLYLNAHQPNFASSSMITRRLLDEDSLARGVVGAAPPVQQYSAPSPPLPDSVIRAMAAHSRQLNRSAGMDPDQQQSANMNVSCPCKQELAEVDETDHSSRVCKVPQWMPKAWLGGQISASDDDLYSQHTPWARPNEVRRLPPRGAHSSNMLQPMTIRSICIYGERCSGTTWITNLVKKNFRLIHRVEVCPNKHDFDLSVPNEFGFLAEDVLALVITRNAIDWSVSMFNRPWFAANHCNVSFNEFVTREWSPGSLRRSGPSPAFCPKYEKWSEEKAQHSNMYYESGEGAYARNVLEVRTWKLQRQLQLCNTRRQSACVRYDDVVADWKAWLYNIRDALHLNTREGFPIEVSSYKGEKRPTFVPHSQLQLLKSGEHSEYYDDLTLRHMEESLDMHWEQRAGFDYDGAFARLES